MAETVGLENGVVVGDEINDGDVLSSATSAAVHSVTDQALDDAAASNHDAAMQSTDLSSLPADCQGISDSGTAAMPQEMSSQPAASSGHNTAAGS